MSAILYFSMKGNCIYCHKEYFLKDMMTCIYCIQSYCSECMKKMKILVQTGTIICYTCRTKRHNSLDIVLEE
jgi:hypothetical protein